MKANLQLLYNDYLKDKNDIRLKLFLWQVNPEFKLNKSNRQQLDLLISDNDNSKLREANLLNFITGNSNIEKKPAGKKKIIQNSDTSFLKPSIQEEYKQLNRQLFDELVKSADKPDNRPNQQVIDNLKIRINELQEQLDLNGIISDPYSLTPEQREKYIIQSEKALVIGYLGNPENEKTNAYKILHTDQPKFILPGDLGLQIDQFDKRTYKVLDCLYKHFPGKKREWLIDSQYSVKNPFTVIVEKDSGLPRYNPERKIDFNWQTGASKDITKE